jgi:Fe2+ transport system protein FeoA
MPVSVWEWIRGSAWSGSCAAGAPVPDTEFCASLECESVCLTELRAGERGSVSCLQNPAGQQACRLAAMGVLPGADLCVTQVGAACVFRIGHAEFAVDLDMARHVRVQRLRAQSSLPSDEP